MAATAKTKSAAIRERLNHPIIDGDGHMAEYLPLSLAYLRDVGGQKLFDKFVARMPGGHRNYDGTGGAERVGGPQGWYGLTEQQRRDMRVLRLPFWGLTTASMLDRATVMLPKLLRERLDDLGIDYSIIYGSMNLDFFREPDEDLRLAGCRATNKMYADLYGPYKDRMAIAAVIPTVTPQEAIAELEYAVNTLGLKAAVFASNVRRPVRKVEREAPEVAPWAMWADTLGISSEYDYDPLWKKCMELKIPVAAHSSSQGVGYRTTAENSMYNHIGHFAASGDAFCKSIVMGGVPARFPKLTFAFLEGGVGWACSLYNDLVESWETRNAAVLRKTFDPAKLDHAALGQLFEEYGEGRFTLADTATAEITERALGEIDEWKALNITDGHGLAKIFEQFFFGCEAEDRMTAVAFNPRLNRYGAKIQALFSSDIGHFDVRDITKVVADAYELVEDGLLDEADFRDFTFGNAAKLYNRMDPTFFKGTPVEEAAKQLVSG